MTNTVTFGGRIAQLVEQHGSLRAVSRVTGVNAPYLCRLKNGEKLNPSDDTLRRLGMRRHIYYTLVPRRRR